MINTELERSKLLMTIWGLLLVFNLWIVIRSPTYTGWAVIGMFVGGLFIMLLHHWVNIAKVGYFNPMKEIINSNYKLIDAYRDTITKLMMEIDNVKRPKRKSKAKR